MSPGNERDLIHAIQVLASATALNAEVCAMMGADLSKQLDDKARNSVEDYEKKIARAVDLRRFSRIG